MAPIDIGFDSNNFNNNNAYGYGSSLHYYNGESESGGFGKAILGFVAIAWNTLLNYSAQLIMDGVRMIYDTIYYGFALLCLAILVLTLYLAKVSFVQVRIR